MRITIAATAAPSASAGMHIRDRLPSGSLNSEGNWPNAGNQLNHNENTSMSSVASQKCGTDTPSTPKLPHR